MGYNERKNRATVPFSTKYKVAALGAKFSHFLRKVETLAQFKEKRIGTTGLIFDKILREKKAFFEKNEKLKR
jgi:predicted transcriptional regulator